MTQNGFDGERTITHRWRCASDVCSMVTTRRNAILSQKHIQFIFYPSNTETEFIIVKNPMMIHHAESIVDRKIHGLLISHRTSGFTGCLTSWRPWWVSGSPCNNEVPFFRTVTVCRTPLMDGLPDIPDLTLKNMLWRICGVLGQGAWGCESAHEALTLCRNRVSLDQQIVSFQFPITVLCQDILALLSHWTHTERAIFQFTLGGVNVFARASKERTIKTGWRQRFRNCNRD